MDIDERKVNAYSKYVNIITWALSEKLNSEVGKKLNVDLSKEWLTSDLKSE